MDRKKKYLAMHDYGMGGVWIYIFANSVQEINKKYPMLSIVTKKPAWLEEYEQAGSSLKTIDIDDVVPYELSDLASPGIKIEDHDYLEPFENVLRQFAIKHRLLIDDMKRDSNEIRLCFRLSKGVYGYLLVSAIDPSFLTVIGTMWKDEYASYTRYVKYTQPRKITIKQTLLLDNALEELLQELVASRQPEWTKVDKSYKASWSRYSEQEFINMSHKDWPYYTA
jgi:hypothetical protein